MLGKIRSFLSHFGKEEERELIQKAKRGDGESFGKLYLKYLDGIYRYIYFRINYYREDAEDLTEVVFFKAWKALGNFRGNKIQAWLYMIARNAVLDYQKSKKAIKLDQELEDQSRSLEESLIVRTEIERLKKGLNHLTAEQKEVVTMRFIENLSHKEIGKIIGRKEEAVRAIQYRALRRLKKMLG